MRTSIHKLVGVCLGVLAIAICVVPAFAQQRYEILRRRGGTEIRLVERPALIEELVQARDPVELNARKYAQLKSYLVSASRPHRLTRDRFYQDGRATADKNGASQGDGSRLVLDDPINVSALYPRLDRARDWARLRMHFVYNEELRNGDAISIPSPNGTVDSGRSDSPRKTVAIQVGTNVYWVNVDECVRYWTSKSILGGTLYLTPEGQYVLLSRYARLMGTPARIVDEQAAVGWLTMNGYAVPEELTQTADRLRLPGVVGNKTALRR
jgi:hypothetical protein